METKKKPKILFFSEAVTLAHVVRPLTLSDGLSPEKYEIHFACNPKVIQNLNIKTKSTIWEIQSIPAQKFKKALKNGTPFYSTKILNSYVNEELSLINKIQPDLIIGDFRLSLGVSAKIAKIPYICITNAYWSPYNKDKIPMPDNPVINKYTFPMCTLFFPLTLPLIESWHKSIYDSFYKAHGIPPLSIVKEYYCNGDFVVYPDLKKLAETDALPQNHKYIGPVFWSSEVKPDWWEQVPHDKKIIYLSVGSSGDESILNSLEKFISELGYTLIVSSINTNKHQSDPSQRIFRSQMVPAKEVAKIADLVITNGGSLSSYLSLSEGTPILAIPSNMDQHLSMNAVVKNGAGIILRPENINKNNLAKSIKEILDNKNYKLNAKHLQSEINQANPVHSLDKIISEILQKF